MDSLCLPLRQSDIDAVIARIRAGDLPLIGSSAEDLPPSILIVVGGSLSSKRAALLAKACSDHGCEVIGPAKKIQPSLPPSTIIIADEESHASAAAKVHTACCYDLDLNWARAGGVRDLVYRGSARSVARPVELAGASRHGQLLHHSGALVRRRSNKLLRLIGLVREFRRGSRGDRSTTHAECDCCVEPVVLLHQWIYATVEPLS